MQPAADRGDKDPSDTTVTTTITATSVPTAATIRRSRLASVGRARSISPCPGGRISTAAVYAGDGAQSEIGTPRASTSTEPLAEFSIPRVAPAKAI